MKLTLFTALLLMLANPVQAKEFSDLPELDPQFMAVDYLSEAGIITGYADGTFKAEQPVNRAEAVTMIMRATQTKEALLAAGPSVHLDVTGDAWYRPAVRLAVDNNVVDGPPVKSTFLPSSPVIKAEFLKIVLLAYQVDTNSFSEIRLPLATDVQDPDEWFYKYIRTGLATSMTTVSELGNLDPGRPLSRGDVAQYIYRLLKYREGDRAGALIAEANKQMETTLEKLGESNLTEAEYASARALLAARGAHASSPNFPLVRGEVKVTEAIRTLVRGYQANAAEDNVAVVAFAKGAWSLAEEAQTIEPTLGELSDQVKSIAASLAESARNLGE